MTNEASPVQPGDIIAGKYRVDRLLGKGGMGVVFAATHLTLREVRALKFLLPSALADDETVERFRREARTVLRLKSEHVARVLDVGRLEDGAPFMVMEYLHGYDLGQAIKKHGAVPLETAILYVLQAMDAVAEAHSKGIIHRDLKPANLFLTVLPSGMPCVKVLDFGISKISQETGQDVDMTKTHAVLGSPQFMSPEQMIATKNVDPRTDIWSLGVILYQLTTGKFPFRGRSATEIISVIYTTRPDPPSQLAPHLPPAFDEIVMRCLRLSPAERYATVAELAAALASLAPPSASFTLERINGYATADARNTGSALPAPASSPHPAEDQSDRAPWPPAGIDPMASSMSSAATHVLNLGSKTEVMPAGIPGAPKNVSIATPNPSTVDDSMSAAQTRILHSAPVERQRNHTLPIAPRQQGAAAPAEPAPNADASVSAMQTASTRNGVPLSPKLYVIAVVVASLVLGIVALAVSLSGN